MNEPVDNRGTGRGQSGLGDPLKLAGLLLIVALISVLATNFGNAIRPKPSVQANSETVALQRGVAAFKAGAFSTALIELDPIAKKGSAEAAYWLGRMNEGGFGVKKDVAAAIGWYRKAAEGGWTAAKLQLGEIYFKGTEDLQDFMEARKWLGQAAHDGDARAQLDLGRLYANGWGGDKDPIQAYVWYELAAKQGNYEAQRLRDSLLRRMPEDEIAEAQNLSEKMVSEIPGPVAKGAKVLRAENAPGVK